MSDTSVKKILVAVDGSEQAFEAVRYASMVLPPRESSVVLFHVMTKVPDSFWDFEKEPAYHYKIIDIEAWEAQQQRMIEDFMDQATRVLVNAGIPEDRISVKIGERKVGIARDIVAESEEGYDAVVVGRRGLSELKDLMLGNIANKIIEKLSHTPVWVVGGRANFEKIIVGIDSSEGAMLAVDHVASVLVGGSRRVRVTLFHAIRGINVFQKLYGEMFSVDVDKELVEKIQKELDDAAGMLQPAFEEARRRFLDAGLAPDDVDQRVVTGVASRGGAIVEEAEKGDYDTIVIGRRGLSKVQEFFMGRVSNKVVQLAKEKTVWVVS